VSKNIGAMMSAPRANRPSNNRIREQLLMMVKMNFENKGEVPYMSIDIDWDVVRDLLHPSVASPRRPIKRKAKRLSAGWGNLLTPNGFRK
jgi:hypothetical protein